MTDVVRELTYETAQSLLGQNFQIRFSDATVDLNLEYVQLLMEKHLNPRMKRDAFSMQFRGPRTPTLRQSVYSVHNETLGELTIFLVPLNVAENGVLYEAVFN